MNVLILGATSAIAQCVGRIYAERGATLLLAARNAARVEALRDDLRLRGAARVEARTLELDDVALHDQFIEEAEAAVGAFDVVLLAQGTLGDAAQRVEGPAAAQMVHTNFVAPASLLTEVATRMEARGKGCIAAIGSVAGDRGRQSNYVYGASKGGLALFLQGLRNRLAKHGVQVVTLKPGFVDTPMTVDVPKNPLFSSPEKVARGIVHAIDRRRDVVYLPCFWRLIMCAVRAIPEKIFKRMSM